MVIGVNGLLEKENGCADNADLGGLTRIFYLWVIQGVDGKCRGVLHTPFPKLNHPIKTKECKKWQGKSV